MCLESLLILRVDWVDLNKKLDGKLSTIDVDGQAMLDRMLASADAIKDAYDQLETNKGMRDYGMRGYCQ